MDPLQLRESEVFATLKRLDGPRFVVIGGYAASSYTLPRFSVDCDIVIQHEVDLKEFGEIFLELGYERSSATKNRQQENFARYEKRIGGPFKVSFDVFMGEVFDRQTEVSISSEWIFKNSEIMSLKGKTITEAIRAMVIKVDALFVMKMISCRATDIRDLFMLALSIKDKAWIKREVESRCSFNERFDKLKAKITSREFRDGLQGVYGLIDSRIFEKSLNAVLSLADWPSER